MSKTLKKEKENIINTLPILMHIIPILYRFGSRVFFHVNFAHHEKIIQHNVIDGKFYMLIGGCLEQINKLTYYLLHPNVIETWINTPRI